VVLTRPGARRSDDGAVAVFVALIVVLVVIPLLATVVDLGLTRTLSTRFRGAADAAALAAAADLSVNKTSTEAINDAKALVAENMATPDGGWPAAWASCVDSDPLPEGTAAAPGNCISIDPALKQIRVTVPSRPVPSAFAGVFGTSPPAATATSSATWGDRISPTVGSCALCVLQTYTSGYQRVRVSGGDAAVGTSLRVTWPGGLTVSGAGVTFGTSWTASRFAVSPLPVLRPVPPDPFATTLTAMRGAVPYDQPSSPGPPSLAPCSPGAYQTISNCSSFGAGTYYVTGNPTSTQQVSLNADATNVVLFFTCNRSGGATGTLVATCPSSSPLPRFTGAGSAAHTLTAPGGSGPALVFDQGLSRTESLNSAQQLTIQGDVYGPGVTLRPGGTGIAVVRGRVAVLALTGSTSNFFGSTMLQVTAPPVVSGGLSNGAVRLVRSD
jgi:Flp pilus assembly pilin Flp